MAAKERAKGREGEVSHRGQKRAEEENLKGGFHTEITEARRGKR